MSQAQRFRSIFVRVLVAVVGAAVAAIALSTVIAATLVHDDKEGVIVEDALARADATRTQLAQQIAIARAELRAVALAGTNGMIEEVPALVSGNVIALRCTRGGEDLVDAAADREAHDALAALPIDGPPIELLGRDRLLVRIGAASAQVLAVLDVASLLAGPSGWRLELLSAAVAEPRDTSSVRQAQGGSLVARMMRDASGDDEIRVVAEADGLPTVVVIAPLAPARRAASALTRRVLLFSLLLLLPVLLLAGLLARAVTRPVRSLAAAVRNASDAPVKLPLLPRDEIGDLGHAIEAMSRRRFEDAEGLRAAIAFARRAGEMTDASAILAALEVVLREVVPRVQWRVLRRAELATATDLPAAALRLDALEASDERLDPDLRAADETPLYRQIEHGSDEALVIELYGGPATHALVVGPGVCAPHEERLVHLLCGVASSALRQAELAATAASNQQLAALGRLAAGVAHEINNALAVVLGNVGILEDTAVGDAREIASDVRMGADRVALIVQDLSSFSKGADRITLCPEDLGAIIGASVKQASARRPQVDFEVVPFSPTAVLCDAGRIGQILVNLLGNAADAAVAAQRPLVRVSLVLERALARIEIADRGGGIPRAVQTRIFEPFFTTKGQAGTGLGLFISRTFARAHGGDIRIVETSEDGTTLALTVPLVRARPSSGPPPRRTS